MKRTLLLFALAFMAITASAQKTDSLKKAKAPVVKTEFKPDPKKVYQIGLTADEVDLLTKSPDDWKAIEWSDKLSGQQIQSAKDAAAEVRKSTIRQVNLQINEDYKKWQADTATVKTTPVNITPKKH